MSMPSNNPLNRTDHFNQLYDKHVQHLNLKESSWAHIPLVKSPRLKRLPDVLRVEEVCLLGLRLSETLGLEVGDIDAHRMLVHIRQVKIVLYR